MWWLIPIAVVGAGKLIYDALTDEPVRERPRQKSVLESNLDRLGVQLRSRNGRKIAILGQPGAGKSSLLKGMTGGEAEPPPVIGTLTDATNWSENGNCSLLSIYQDSAFADVPGYDTASHPTHAFLSYFPWSQFDAFILVVGGKIHLADESIYKCVAGQGKKICVARSYSESLCDSEKSVVENDLRNRFLIPTSTPVVFFSNRTGEGVPEVYCAIQ